VLLVAASVPRGDIGTGNNDLRLVADPHYSADTLLQPSAAINASTVFTFNNYNIPRGGGGRRQLVRASDKIDVNSADHGHTNQTSSSTTSSSTSGQIGALLLPKRLLTVAKNIVGRTANILFFKSRRQQQSPEEEDVNVDHTFDELDRIIENTSSVEVPQQNQHPRGSDRNDVDNQSSWPTLPQGISSLTGGWKQRTFRHWINQVSANNDILMHSLFAFDRISLLVSSVLIAYYVVINIPNQPHTSQMERKFLSSETANALKTIRNIIEKFPEYGVVDLFGMYR